MDRMDAFGEVFGGEAGCDRTRSSLFTTEDHGGMMAEVTRFRQAQCCWINVDSSLRCTNPCAAAEETADQRCGVPQAGCLYNPPQAVERSIAEDCLAASLLDLQYHTYFLLHR